MRVTRGTPATLTVTFYADENPTDADDIVMVTIANADGSTFDSGEATHVGDVGSGMYSIDMAGRATLNSLTATWAGVFEGAPASIVTYVEIVGGTYFTVAELRAEDAALTVAKYPLAAIQNIRDEVETEFERICNRAFVPRFARETVTGNGTDTIALSKYEPLSILSIDGAAVADSAIFETDGYRDLSYVDGTSWASGTRFVIEYEYGMQHVPLDIKQAALHRARGKLVSGRSRIDERATVMSIPDFGTFNLSTPGQRGAFTGIPDIDLVLNDWAYGRGGIV